MVMEMVSSRITDCPTTPADIARADDIFGKSIPNLKGTTLKKSTAISFPELSCRVTQKQQVMDVDIFCARNSLPTGTISSSWTFFCD